jgi:DNA-binding SARP family transcriptional activator/class 3 adenylate cyclase
VETVGLLEDRVEFRVLGPLEVVHEARPIAVPGVRERALLVFLLLSANRVVPSERLADALCGDLAPERATKTLRVYVSRLRRALRDASKDELLLSRPPGYVLRVDPEAYDAFRFEQLTSEGRRRAMVGDYEGSADVLRAALALWRGPALADLLDFPFAQGEATRLEEARLAALEGRIEAELRVGRHGELTGELEGLTREHPFRERLWGQRMLALYRSGRQADALACFQQLRRFLGEELGIEPGTALRTLEASILRHDPDLEWSPTPRPPEEATQATVRPHQELQERADRARLASLLCTRCGRSTAADQRFCGWCGNPSPLTCPSCGHGNPTESLFCEACGVALRMPPAEGVLAEERRWATVLCSELAAPDARDITDPEGLRARRAQIVRDIRVILERFGASTVQVAEDHVLAAFGAPHGHDDDPERAVRAALELQSWAEARREGQGDGLLRVAINTGDVLFGRVDPQQPFTVVGRPVSTAFRFRAEASPGQIIVGEETYRATRHAFRYKPIPAVAPPGEGVETTPAFLVVEALGSPGGRRVSDTPLVGRTRELGMAEAVWERVVADRTPHLLTVLGPAGIGKSRFARELSDRVERGGARVISGRSLPFGEQTGFGAFAHQVTAAAGITDEDSAPAAREKLVRRISTLVAPTAATELASHLALLIGLQTEVTADRGTLFLAARRFVEALGREQPTVLVYEDLHWADAALFDLVETLAGRARDAPLLLVALARPQLFDVRPRWGAGLTASTVIELPDLTSEQSRDLLGSLLPNAGREVPVDSFIEVAGGNPLFLEELSASFLEGRANGHPSLPASILATVGARLDMLPPSERRVLLNASVLGMRFWAGALRALVPDEDLSAILDALEARDLVHRETFSSVEGQDGYSFKHVLIRDVAYGRLPRADRATRHAAVARFIEQTAGDRVVEVASVLGHHWREAGEPVRAVPYLLTAAARAARAWAKDEAVALFSHALDLIPPSEAELRQSTRLRRALTMVEAGQFVAARDELDLIIPELRGRERSEDRKSVV